MIGSCVRLIKNVVTTMKERIRNPKLIATVSIGLVVLVTAYYVYFRGPTHTPHPRFPFSSVSDLACQHDDSKGPDEAAGKTTIIPHHVIPNIVHYVWVLENPHELHLDFKVFLSVYSAHLFWRPDKIYIHTDASPELFARARSASNDDVWTRRALALPGVTPNFVEAPTTTTTKGVPIKHLEHKADFLRISALRQFGGVYVDVDVVPLRDITALRQSGFANIVGGATALSVRHSGFINNGVLMAVAHSALMDIYHDAAHDFFDGSWSRASVHLLTDLARRLVPLPFEVLILEPEAFAPMGWELEDQKRLFLPALGPPSTTQEDGVAFNATSAAVTTCQDALAWLRQRGEGSMMMDAGKEIDFSGTYALHAFDDGIKDMWGWDHRVDVKYVMERRSNYARAVYPALRHAVQAGIIPEAELV